MIKREISRRIPTDVPPRFFSGGAPILTAYGCALLERDTGKSFVYTAVNLKTGKTEVLSRRSSPMTTHGVDAMVERLRNSVVAGAGQLEVDRAFGETISIGKCREILLTLFNEILPQHGYAVRTEQIALAEHILDAIFRRGVSLAEAEVGTGKTLAYLVPAVLAKRGRVNDHWNIGFYKGASYIATAQMPIVVATSSIALQKAIVTDYIPELSDILMTHGIIRTPLTTVIRKGRKHYICEKKLRAHTPFELNAGIGRTPVDIAEIDDLTPLVKRKISVPNHCDADCPYRDGCIYLNFRSHAQSPDIDIQVCNHNYLLADIIRRAGEQSPLIPNYQSIIIDEAHRFFSAARDMYSVEFMHPILSKIKDEISAFNFKHESADKSAQKLAKKLASEGNRLFLGVETAANSACAEDECVADMDDETTRHLRNIGNLSGDLIEALSREPVAHEDAGRKARLVGELKKVNEQSSALARQDGLICWTEKAGGGEKCLCALPKDLGKRLFADIWSKGIPTILTSGTLSASADFSRVKQNLGLERVGNRLSEVSFPSPYDYYKNGLIYISEGIPFPDPRNPAYIAAITDEIEKVVRVSHGHAAVLFTSYNVMGRVYAALKNRLPFPMFRLDKGGVREIERFKQSGNGVLFASGAMWEGIDIPGHALSLLVMVKLPFAQPDFAGEYERRRYKSRDDYMGCVIEPDCAVKARQIFGRVFRLEDDTGAVVFIDCRMALSGALRDYILDALPYCRVTSDMQVLDCHFKLVKPIEYFE